MDKRTITVFTPTYNRAHTLWRTYESLCRQTCKDFEWLVIDDGSTDNTEELVRGWIAENRIPIRYIHKKNGGLYTGYNAAFLNIETELSVCVDSDDFMPDNAIQLILDYWHKNGSERYMGITGLDFTLDGRPIGGLFREDLFEAHIIDIDHKGDTKQVFRTELVKRLLPMEGFDGEKNFNPHYLHMLLDNGICLHDNALTGF